MTIKIRSDEIAEDVKDDLLVKPNFPGVRLKPRLPTRIRPAEYISRDRTVFKFDPEEPRDEGGRWTEGGGVGHLVEGTKAVGSDGKPVRVYHGAQHAFQEFRDKPAWGALGPGYYFTVNPAEASSYAEPKPLGRGEKPEPGLAPNVHVAYLKVKKLFDADKRDKEFLKLMESGSSTAVARLQAKGYDAIKSGDWWIVFDRSQIVHGVKLAKAANHKGVMVAVRIPRKVADEVALPGGEEPEDLHLTLVYLGDADEIDPDKLQKLHDNVEAVATRTPPFSGALTGYGRFTNGDDDVVWAGLDAPDLAEFRHAVLQAATDAALEPAGDHGWTPHVTLAYAPDEATAVDMVLQMERRAQDGEVFPVTVKDVSVVVAGTETMLRLRGERDPGDKGPQRLLPASTFSELQRPKQEAFASVKTLEEWAQGRGGLLVRPAVDGALCVVVKKGRDVRVALQDDAPLPKEVRLDDLISALKRIDHDFVAEGALVARDLMGRWVGADEINQVLEARELATPIFMPCDLLVMDGDLTGKTARERFELLRALVAVAGEHVIVPPQIECASEARSAESLGACVDEVMAWRPSEGEGFRVLGVTCVSSESHYAHGETDDAAEYDPGVEKYDPDQSRDEAGRWSPLGDTPGLLLPGGGGVFGKPGVSQHKDLLGKVGMDMEAFILAGGVRMVNYKDQSAGFDLLLGNADARRSVIRYLQTHRPSAPAPGFPAVTLDTYASVEEVKSGENHVREFEKWGQAINFLRDPGVEKYDEDEARDDRGRWTTGYHGTTSKSLASILTHGLQASKSGHVWPEYARRGKTYFSTDASDAVEWGQEAAIALTSPDLSAAGKVSGNVALLELRIPESERRRVKVDPHFLVDEHNRRRAPAAIKERVFDGDIKPEWIVHAWESKGFSDLAPLSSPAADPKRWRVVKAVESPGGVLYVAVFLPDDVEKEFAGGAGPGAGTEPPDWIKRPKADEVSKPNFLVPEKRESGAKMERDLFVQFRDTSRALARAKAWLRENHTDQSIYVDVVGEHAEGINSFRAETLLQAFGKLQVKKVEGDNYNVGVPLQFVPTRPNRWKPREGSRGPLGLADPTVKYDESEPRDNLGRWTDGGVAVDESLAPIADRAAKIVKDLNARYGNFVRAVKPSPMGGDVLAHKSHDTIYLNAEKVNDPKFWAGHEREWDGIRVDPSLEGVLAHEYGHVLFGRALNADPERYRRDITPLANDTMNATSPYGQEHASEKEAEAFAAVHAGRTAWSDPTGAFAAGTMDHARRMVAAARDILARKNARDALARTKKDMVSGGGSGDGDSTGAPAFGSHRFVVGDLVDGEFVPDGKRGGFKRVNPYEAIFLRRGVRLRKYSDDQPRVPAGSSGGGQWTSGGGSQALYIPREGERTIPLRDVADVRREVTRLAEKFGISEGRINVAEQGREFDVADKHFNEAGHVDPLTNTITLRPAFFDDIHTEPERDGMFAHEVMHTRFNTVLVQFKRETNEAEAETTKMEDAAKASNDSDWRTVGPMNSAGFLRTRDKDGKSDVDGEVPEAVRDKYPVLAGLEQYMSGSLRDRLEKEDGFTEYSRAWWDKWKSGTLNSSIWTPVHETLAEVARMYDQRRNMWPSGQFEPSPVIKDFYNAVNNVADAIGLRGKMPRAKSRGRADYLFVDRHFRPVEAEDATMVKVVQDGRHVWGVLADVVKWGPDPDRPAGGNRDARKPRKYPDLGEDMGFGDTYDEKRADADRVDGGDDGQVATGAEEGGVRRRGGLPGGQGLLEARGRSHQEAGGRCEEGPLYLTKADMIEKYDPDQPRDPAGTSTGGQWTGAGRDFAPALEGLPTKVKVPGVGEVEAGPWGPAREAAESYMRGAGLPYDPPRTYAKVNPERASRIAAEFDHMKDDPRDPEVKAAYGAMVEETLAQYQVLKSPTLRGGAGLRVEAIPPGQNPYAASPRLMTQDVRENNHMWYFPTAHGFGSDEKFDASDNPLLASTKETDVHGTPMVVNDVFRVVHDYFGHVKEGVGFRADGEENAWRSHSAMYSDLARRAMTTETRGQNSWVNYGPHGESNRSASSEKTVFADQKIGLLPAWVSTEGARDTKKSADDGPLYLTKDDMVERQGPPATGDAPRRPKRPGDPEDAPGADGTLL